jgi:glyoxylase-like metal-dependent hydrolase (beta-lactamase superfamily II)
MDLSKVEVQVVPVGPGLAMLEGAGGNLAVAYGDSGVFVVDDQYAPMHDKLVAAIGKLSSKPVRFILNTHWHGDHVGGNEAMAGMGTLLVAHDNVRQRMSTEQVNKLFDDTTPPSPAAALPVVTFETAVSFHVNGEEIRAQHVPPAHTDGDSIVWFTKADAVHMGDTFFNGMYPFIDRASGGSTDGVIGAAEIVLAKAGPATKIIPGHGPLGDRAALQAFRDMMVGCRDAVRALAKAGKTIDETMAAKPTAPWDAKWGTGFIKPELFVQMLYDIEVGRDDKPAKPAGG